MHIIYVRMRVRIIYVRMRIRRLEMLGMTPYLKLKGENIAQYNCGRS